MTVQYLPRLCYYQRPVEVQTFPNTKRIHLWGEKHSCMQSYLQELCAMGLNFCVSCGSGYISDQIVAMSSYHAKNRNNWKWAAFTTKNWAFQVHNFGTSYISEFWSYHHMMKRTLYSVINSLSSRCQNCDWTNICSVAIKNPQMSHTIWCYFTASQQVLVELHI